MAFSSYPHDRDRPDLAPPLAARVPVPTQTPVWTYILLGINVLVWLAMTALGGSEDVRVLILFGAKFHPLIAAGEYWRLVTANFLHIGFIHLAFNSWALYLFGLQVESRFGRGRFLVLYILSGIGGTVLSYVGSRAVSAGASGAIFGLVGAITVYYATYREAFGAQGRRQLSSLLLITGYNLVWGLMNPRIDNLGHIGGLLAGAALGWAFCPRYELERLPEGRVRLSARYSALRALASVVLLGLTLGALTWLGTMIHS